MNRKFFLSSIIGLPAVASMAGSAQSRDTIPVIPPYLKPGDAVGITCPAGWITDKEIQPSVQQMENWGLKVKIGDTVGKKDFTFGGSDDDRRMDLQRMLDDRSIQAIMCARGGYGSVRLIDDLDFSVFLHYPKWIIGFSDITVLHSHLIRNFNIASIHSKMCNSFPDDMQKAEPLQIDSILSIRDALYGEKVKYPVLPNEKNRVGICEGVLTGGNLKTIESLSGSASDIKTDGRILFVEDTGEYLYSVDRMFWNLKRTGKLSALKGLIVGGFKIRPDDPGDEFGRTLTDIVLERVKEYKYPVCLDFPVGHQKSNFALKCGIKHRLEVTNANVNFLEV